MNKVKAYQKYYDGIETLFAVHENGLIETCTRKYSSAFNEKTDKWTQANELPKDVEYIGKYTKVY